MRRLFWLWMYAWLCVVLLLVQWAQGACERRVKGEQ